MHSKINCFEGERGPQGIVGPPGPPVSISTLLQSMKLIDENYLNFRENPPKGKVTKKLFQK